MNKETIIKQFQEHDFVILDKEIKGIKYPINIEKDGYKYYICYNAIYKTWNPKKWGENNPYSLENLALYLLRNGYKCQVVDTNDKYDYNCVKLQCECGNIYEVNISNLLKKRQDTCPHCSAIKGNLVRENHIKYDKYLEDNNLKIIGKYRGCKHSAYFKSYNTNYIYFGTLYNAINSDKPCDEYFKSGLFDKKNKLALYNIKQFIKENNLDVEVLAFDGAKSNIVLKCPKCHNQFTTSFYYFISNKINQCQQCTRQNTSKFDIQKFCKDNHLQIKSKFTNTFNPLIFRNKDGYYLYISVWHYNNNKNNESTIFHNCNPRIIDNIKNYIKINKLQCKLLSNKYIDGNHRLKFQCKCGQIYHSRLYDVLYNNHVLCDNCRTKIHSKMEKQVREILLANNISFSQQQKFNNCRNKNLLPFDFYLSDYNLCIECQGIQHFEVIEYFGGEEKLRRQQINDKIKFDYCQNNNINIIYITYKNTQEQVEEILSQINYMKKISNSS